jgi:hypothetical protein
MALTAALLPLQPQPASLRLLSRVPRNVSSHGLDDDVS